MPGIASEADAFRIRCAAGGRRAAFVVRFHELPRYTGVVMINRLIVGCIGTLVGAVAIAAPETFNIDPNHTYPSFSADHMGGLSVWRGKFKSSSGKIVYDKEAGSGTVSVTVDTNTIDFGHDKLNEHVKTA